MIKIKKVLLVGLILVFPAFIAATENRYERHQNLNFIGEGSLKVFLWQLYDVRLLSDDKTFSWNNDLVLEFAYKRELKKKEVIDASVKEMRRQKGVTEKQLKNWQNYLERGIQTAQKATKASLYWTPNGTITFFYDGLKPVTIDNASFARAFMNIWLGPDTSEPELRRALLGKNSS